MRKWQQSQRLSATLNYTSARCGRDSVQNLSKRHCVVTLWYTVICHTVCNKNPKLTRRVQMTGCCVNYEASCKITRQCVGTHVCACSETTTLSARVRSRGMECEEPQAEDFEGVLVCFGERKREVALSSGSEKGRQYLLVTRCSCLSVRLSDVLPAENPVHAHTRIPTRHLVILHDVL